MLWLSDADDHSAADAAELYAAAFVQHVDAVTVTPKCAYLAAAYDCNMCVTPVTLRREVSAPDGSNVRTVPCGKCVHCLRKKQREWIFRLHNELKVSSSAFFITLTYSDENLIFVDGLPTLYKPDFQNFMKRLRHLTPSKLKYYACGEYGDRTHRPHYHAIIFNLPSDKETAAALIESAWQDTQSQPLGHVHIGTVNFKSISYVTKYHLKGDVKVRDDDPFGRIPEFSLISKGLGLAHLTPEMIRYYRNQKDGMVNYSGGYLPLPRYYREKLFTDDEFFDKMIWKAHVYSASKKAAEEHWLKNFEHRSAEYFVQWARYQDEKFRQKNVEKVFF